MFSLFFLHKVEDKDGTSPGEEVETETVDACADLNQDNPSGETDVQTKKNRRIRRRRKRKDEKTNIEAKEENERNADKKKAAEEDLNASVQIQVIVQFG